MLQIKPQSSRQHREGYLPPLRRHSQSKELHNKATELQMHQLPQLQQTQSEEHNLRKPHFSGQELPKLARNT